MTQWLSGPALLSMLCLAAPTAAQPAPRAAPDRAKVLEAAREVMQKARYATLVTLGEDGHPQARVVDPFAPEAGLTVWIATSAVTRKVEQVRRDPRVTLLYFEPASEAYVTILGRAEAVSDPAEKARRWKDEWAPFYKDKNRGDDYLLLRVKPIRLEITSEAHGLMNDPQTWLPVIIDFP